MSFDGLIDGGEDDLVSSDVNNDAAAGKIGDDFVTSYTLLGRCELN